VPQFYLLRQIIDVNLGIHHEVENYDHLTERGTEVREGTTVISLFDYSEPRIASSEN
jgi:hypothetical protein